MKTLSKISYFIVVLLLNLAIVAALPALGWAIATFLPAWASITIAVLLVLILFLEEMI